MPEFIAGSPNQNVWAINNSGAGAIGAYSGGTIYPLQVDSSGALLTAGGGTYFPGSNVILESLPTDSAMNNSWMTLTYISSGTSTGIDTGSSIGSIVQFVGTGSYVKHLTYSNNNLTNIESWV